MNNKTRIWVFDCTTGTSNKFYTMIETPSGEIVCNYGPNDMHAWVKTTTYPFKAWNDVADSRLKHKYTKVYDGWIDYAHYEQCREKLGKLNSSPELSVLWKTLLKWGNLTVTHMCNANNLFKQQKGT